MSQKASVSAVAHSRTRPMVRVTIAVQIQQSLGAQITWPRVAATGTSRVKDGNHASIIDETWPIRKKPTLGDTTRLRNERKTEATTAMVGRDREYHGIENGGRVPKDSGLRGRTLKMG